MLGALGGCLADWWIVSSVGELIRAVGGESPLQVLPHTNFKTYTIHTKFNIKIPVYYRRR